MVNDDLKQKILGSTGNRGYQVPVAVDDVPIISLDAMAQYVGGSTDAMATWGGDKFYNGFGITKNYEIVNHDLLRKRSKQLFTENLYARGLIRRLVTNEINKGLSLEAMPDADILKALIDPAALPQWSENTERRFTIWSKNSELCDYKGLNTFGALMRLARMMAIISGDALIILRQIPITLLPTVEIVDADHISNPLSDTLIRAVRNRGNKIVKGVEIDKRKRHIAFFVKQSNGIHKRVPAVGPKSGRLQAWLIYGTEKLVDDIRGTSLLALVVQSLKEIDRYRDSEQRSAVINSMIAMWVKKTDDKASTLPFSAGATRRDTLTTQNDSRGRKDIEFSSSMPGVMLQEMQTGEEPVSYDTRRPNVNFGVFETAVISAVAWANEIPPEILFLGFSNNYSASRGAVNEFKMYLDLKRTSFGEEFCSPIYIDYLISDTLNNKIDAPGLIEARTDRTKWDIFGAWVLSEWSGAIKPNVDLLKEVKAYKELASEGWITRDRAARELTGMKFSKVVRQLIIENAALVDGLQPLIDNGLIQTKDDDKGMK